MCQSFNSANAVDAGRLDWEDYPAQTAHPVFCAAPSLASISCATPDIILRLRGPKNGALLKKMLAGLV